MKTRTLSCMAFLAVLILVDAAFFRIQIGDGFSRVFGEPGADGIIEDALVEHWNNVIRGLSSWSEPDYFLPYRNTLGYNDGYFLYGMIGSVFRTIGFDPFLSSELVNVTIKTIGFIAFFAASRRMLKLSFGWSIFAAALFSLSHSSFLQAGHAQLLTVSFVPLLALLIWESLSHLRDADQRKLIAYGTASGALFAAWAFTAFYMAWFFVYMLVFFSIMMFLIDRASFLDTIRFAMRERKAALAVIGAVTAIVLAPFLFIYLSIGHVTGMHRFHEVRAYLLGPTDIFNVGTGNLLFGSLYAKTMHLLYPAPYLYRSEATTGFTPIILILLVCAFVWLARGRERSSRPALLVAMALATIVTWIFCFHIRQITGWHPIYVLFPGAKGVRVISRYQTFLMAPVVALVVCYLAHLSRRTAKPVVLAISALLLAGEIDLSTPGMFDRKAEIAQTTVDAPPAECRSFFVTAMPDQVSDSLLLAFYPHNVRAMMIAELDHIPTINGYATFRVPDWDFGYPDRMDYTERVAAYAERHSLVGLCRLNLATKRWEPNWRPD